jgi:hypothetical protein
MRDRQSAWEERRIVRFSCKRKQHKNEKKETIFGFEYERVMKLSNRGRS